jgi:hypothetical protein
MAIKEFFHVSYKSFNIFCLYSILNFSFQSYQSIIESSLHKIISGLYLRSHYEVHPSTLFHSEPDYIFKYKKECFCDLLQKKVQSAAD